MKHAFFFLLILIFSVHVFAQKTVPPERPKLIVGIVVEQMRYDYLFKYWDKYSEDGFKKLVSQGASCINANYNYHLTQSGVGHATIATGALPAQHGIVSLEWNLGLKDKKIYCAGDEQEKTVGSTSFEGKRSPRNLMVSTIGDEIKLASMKKSKVFGVSLRDCSSILLAGHTANGAYWYDTKTGNWITSTYYTDALPSWVDEFNNKMYADVYLGKQWNTLQPIASYTESLSDKNIYEEGYGDEMNVFPYDLQRLKKKMWDYKALRYTPFGNTMTKDFAITTIVSEKLGKGSSTDYLALSFSATDYLGDLFGPTSVEVEDTYLRLDQDLAHFITFIENEIGKQNVLIYLTSDHGAPYHPKFMESQKIPAGTFNNKTSISVLKAYLKAVYGRGEWVSHYSEQQIFLNRNLIEDSKLSLPEVQNKVAQFMVQFAGVSSAISADNLQKGSYSRGIYAKLQNSYNQKRSGDVFICLEPNWVENDIQVIHTSYNYDTHVPLVWYGWKIGRKTISRNIDMTDIAPTISTFMDIPYPNACSGTPIKEIVE